MTDQYEKVVRRVQEEEDSEYLDFHARRLVEAAGNILMGHLLLLDATREPEYKKSAGIFIKMARAENISKVSFINNFSQRDMSEFKQ
ncbi:MAG: Acyl-CoA dehydrogenase C-terminal domain-containing protein [Bacteroidales bacterium]|nr:Acyl-CoA dehydrogenase C-terminal domain-containing protein [Bacteroidales bacterium]